MNLLTLISLCIIFFSQFLLFFVGASESGGIWGVFILCFAIILVSAVFCVLSLFGLWSEKKNILIGPACVVLIVLNCFGAFLFLTSSYSSIDRILKRDGKYILSEKPEQKYFDQSKINTGLEAATYVYWVHLKDKFENDCCVVNPSPQTTDQSYVFISKLGVSQQGYVGVVCSPDCGSGKVIWQGEVTFTEDGRLKLTPTGPEEYNFNDHFETKTEVWETEIYSSGCKNPSCLVTKKTFSSNIDLKLQENNLIPYSEYDVYLCRSSCNENDPYWLANPMKCKAEMESLYIDADRQSCY